jgi:hypothetical protein
MKSYKKMQILKSCFNLEASNVMKGLISGMESILEGVDVTFFLKNDSGEPTNFHKAYNHHDSDKKVKWWNLICKMIKDIKNKEE